MRLGFVKACLLALGFLVPLQASADLEIVTESLRLQFSSTGDLLYAEACFPGCAGPEARSRVLSAEQGMLNLVQDAPRHLQYRRERSGSATILSFTDPAGATAHSWHIPDQGWLLSLESTARSASLASGIEFRPAPASGFGYLLEQTRYLDFDGASIAAIGLDETDKSVLTSTGWLGFRNRFWTAMVLSPDPLAITAATGDELQDARLDMTQPQDGGLDLSLYLGPVEISALSEAAPELGGMLYSGLWSWLRWVCLGMYHLLNFIALAVPQWGLAVILLSLVVSVLMAPLNRIADRLQDQVHEIDARVAPLLAEIKKSHKGAEQSEKIIAMYKDEGVHPLYSLKSLAGVMLIIPVFIGAFNMLAENIHLSGVSFLWMADLSQPDMFWKMPFGLPFFGEYLNLLPFIMTGLSLVASKLHGNPAMDAALRSRQTRNLVLMAIAFLVLFYTFPAVMVLYWTTSNLVSVIKSLRKRWRQGKAPVQTG